MAWVQSHQQIERHPKTHVLMSLMGWDLDTAISKLHRFWWWCLDFAPTGDLHGKNDAVLAGSVGLVSEDGKRFVDAMVESRWIDRDDEVFRVHDWPQYAGRYLKESKFKRQPKKQREMNAVYRKKNVQGQAKVDERREEIVSVASATDAAAPPTAATKTPSAFVELRTHFEWKWEQRYGRKYPFGKIDGVKCAELLKTCGGCLEDAKAVIDRYITDEGIFYQGHPLGVLMSASQLPRFIAPQKQSHRNGKPTVADRDREVAERARAELEAELRMHQ